MDLPTSKSSHPVNCRELRKDPDWRPFHFIEFVLKGPPYSFYIRSKGFSLLSEHAPSSITVLVAHTGQP